MAKPINEELKKRTKQTIENGKIKTEEITTNYYFESRKDALIDYEKNRVKQITVRLPKRVFKDKDGKEKTIDATEVLKDYIKDSKYNSVNDMINKLLDAEIKNEKGKTIDELMTEIAKANGYTEITDFSDINKQRREDKKKK